ncbi:MAG: serine--tRNA ligase [Bacteroidota bacterium]|nr:serine--tRNA ligase [Candidatus Kapabacteria bacterium]MDW8220573.1 serine--tRNA ligase [Bacteroidota bacterium]
MLDTKFIRENTERVLRVAHAKHTNPDIQGLIQCDERRRAIIQQAQDLKARRNSVSEEIARRKKAKQDASDLITEMKTVADTIKRLDDELRSVEEQMEQIALFIPNLTHESVPHGSDASQNVEIRRYDGIQPCECERGFRKDHVTLAKERGIVDFERGAKIAGSGFPLYVGKGAQLERALLNFMLEYHIAHGYTEVFVPFLVNEASMRGTGQLPKFAEDMYACQADALYLIPTAEVSITNIYRDEILHASELPKKLCGYSACFRREAGSYGKDTRGFLRLHQFNKVELVKFAKPQESYAELESLVHDAEAILKALQIPYRVVLLCDGDTGFSSAKTYDIEVWSPAEQKWLEVSSCSNFEDFQARRAQIRYRPEHGAKLEFVHTLNGSGLATPRLMVALLEHYQTESGKIHIPEPLQSYCGFNSI